MSHVTRAALFAAMLAIVSTWYLVHEVETRVMAWHHEVTRNERLDAANAGYAAHVYSSPIYLQQAFEEDGCPERTRCGWYGGVLPNGQYDEMIVWSRWKHE
jgi:hypothetical protein